MKKVVIIISLICICAVFVFSVTFAETPEQPKGQIIGPLNKKTDLRVDNIYAANCKTNCDLNDVDAFYMDKIIVGISNNYEKSGGAEVAAEIKITYYDLGLGRSVTVTKTSPSIKPHPINPWLVSVTMVDRPVLVKKSTGIRAEVKIIPPPLGPRIVTITDSDPSNNVKTVHQCGVILY
ncbi:hypothetical protein [Thermodesulfovibrio sp.]|uniref:hypothetical protein n=1 Tax=Thermodesulfovibrio sp. TaxID=2067987 RepID=UPI0030B6F10E